MNRLADSLSPYLLQHQNNPVDWFPWCDEAIGLARTTDRPIFLSIGYAACHWCHVMEHESFENESIAKFLNEHFVSIKVDREERPDIDQIYMNAVQLMTGRGGWPMSVFLNHDCQPFYAGTYWPPQSRQGMPGFAQVLDAIVDAWTSRRADVNEHATEMNQALVQLAKGAAESSSAVADSSVVEQATQYLLRVHDRAEGGFGGAPKFPHATDLDLFIRQGVTTGNEELIATAQYTLDKMSSGGIRDHIGGGFSRYSVDGRWLVPHFEKMLYDNSLLAELYIRAFQVTGHDRNANVARQTLDYLCREMVDDEGGFHCSEDADSEGVEGKYYVWTPQEVVTILGEERGRRFCKIYDITEHGNFEGENIANLPRSVSDWSGDWSMDVETLESQLAEDREKLRLVRDRRIHPGRDDKVITAWNSLAIKALAVAGGVLNEARYIDAAERAAEFTMTKLTRDDGRLLHAFRGGRSHLDGYVDDYAYTIEAFIALFEATGRARWVGRATKLADFMLTHFRDIEHGGFYYTADDAEALIARTKDWHDGSLISGNASAANGLLRLSRLCDRDDFRVAAERILMAAGDVLEKQSAACGALVSTLALFHDSNEQWVLAVRDVESLQVMRAKLFKKFRPHVTYSWVVGSSPESGPVVALNENRQTVDSLPTLYRCKDFACDRPLTGEHLEQLLS